MCRAKIPGYSFEYVPTPLSSGGVGLFIDESLNYKEMYVSKYVCMQTNATFPECHLKYTENILTF